MADQRRQDPTPENDIDEINGFDNVTDGDLVLDDDDDVLDSNWLQWLRALDLHFIGACRADERLTPLFKFNTSPSPLDDRLLSYLTQHFEASEVGLLARCLCVPLVSMRVGKVIKEGMLLCPTSTRGTLKFTLRPSSDLRISFVGDNGQTQRLATLRDVADVAIEEISADQSGRSFLIKVPGGEIFYFWCSEKSKLLGLELLQKMKDLLENKPTLPEMTGISESRLDCLATHLRTYLAGSNVDTQTNGVASSANMRPVTESEPIRSSPTSARHLCFCPQSPRSGSYEECFSSIDSSLKTGDLPLTSDNRLMMNSGIENHPEASRNSSSSPPLSSLESLGKCSFPPPSAIISPYYCWCPPFSSPIKPITMLQLPTTPTPVEPFTLPPLSSLLPSTGTPVDLAGMGLPPFVPLMCDPIVHIPVLDVCSSGQGYLVGAGPGADSLVDKGARETLRMLIGSQASAATLMNVLPAVLNEDKRGDVDAIVNNFAPGGLGSLSERSLRVGDLEVSGSGGTTDDGGQFIVGLDVQGFTSTFMSFQEKKDC